MSNQGNIELLSATLAKAKSEDRAALVAYLPAGFPTVDGAIEAAKAIIAGGADVVEIGLPHSDPVLDGAVIQTADDIALRGGVKIADVLRTVRETFEATGVPILVMTYWNPIDRYGVERFTAELAAAGGAGCILPDLPVQESALWREHAAEHGLATVFVVAPSSRDERLATITAAGSGFVYAASLMGVTGTRESVGNEAQELVRRTRTTTELPVCVGLGVSNAVQAKQVAGFADGVIVGSAFVKLLLDAPDEQAGLAAVRALAGELAEGVRRS
ncbi:tryptophan synthase subunit alpha [Streptomyces lavendulae]|uniref:Tryptophan synthase alpha chain n=1 Tax=Streptomyces lavendulae subsp. lavendulae TaxID=58340 RepID=A0A2K8PKD6_STRLA|nr:tryptophan synthase subunit alpha [Streptomyces lavendulae]ATZ27206.1 Tryptophan synthase alpha chain [Streptomyces lavendulae subsp. lavendulae]QUQ57033.1 Tryptophan synthase alpha chain [Streptomyces lavendulae subsp. lavendulae]GLW01297.1 tryptophan synthase alpha chain [Streptomyces lavendulae subsp. lavendulae]GLX36546.1 tryptophan synthase alpha chain [Streptomyces roseochromogenus]